MNIFRLPDLGEGLQEAELVEWRVAAGEDVAVDQPLVAVETAKAVVEIPSPRGGRIERLFASAGDVIRIGAPLVGFEGAGEDTGSVVGAVQQGAGVVRDQPISVGHVGGAVRATPAVRALARKLNVDLAMVTPSGADGLITTQDIERVARILSETEAAEPLRGVRRAMAHNMAQAQAEVAAATIVDDADIDAWACRNRHDHPPDPRSRPGVQSRACAQRLVRASRLRASSDEEDRPWRRRGPLGRGPVRACLAGCRQSRRAGLAQGSGPPAAGRGGAANPARGAARARPSRFRTLA